MSAATPARRTPARRITRITDSAPSGRIEVKDAGTQLARLFGEQLLERMRAQQSPSRVPASGQGSVA